MFPKICKIKIILFFREIELYYIWIISSKLLLLLEKGYCIWKLLNCKIGGEKNLFNVKIFLHLNHIDNLLLNWIHPQSNNIVYHFFDLSTKRILYFLHSKGHLGNHTEKKKEKTLDNTTTTARQILCSVCILSFIRNKWFMLDEIVYWNASIFAIFLE